MGRESARRNAASLPMTRTCAWEQVITVYRSFQESGSEPTGSFATGRAGGGVSA